MYLLCKIQNKSLEVIFFLLTFVLGFLVLYLQPPCWNKRENNFSFYSEGQRNKLTFSRLCSFSVSEGAGHGKLCAPGPSVASVSRLCLSSWQESKLGSSGLRLRFFLIEQKIVKKLTKGWTETRPGENLSDNSAASVVKREHLSFAFMSV